MNNEFKVQQYKDATVYTLESASGGSTGVGSVASSSMPIGSVQRRKPGQNLIAQEADKNTVPASTPRNFVAKNAKTGGAGAHRDKKKEQKQGVEKHKKPFMEDHADAAHGWGAGSYDTYAGGRHGRGVAENPEWYSDEANSMSSSQLKSLYKHAVKLRQAVQKMQAQGDTLEPWQQSKVTKAADYLDAVFNAVDDEHDMGEEQGVAEAAKHGLYYNVNKRKKAGTSRPASSPKAPTAQAWKDAAKTAKNEGVDEGLGQWARNAALAGALAVGSMGAHADVKDVPSGGHNQLPDIVAHVKFKVGDKEISKDINLGSYYRSPGEAGEELKNFLNSKGIKFYEYSLERVKPTNNNLDSSPATGTGNEKSSMDTKEPASNGKNTGDYMAKEDAYMESLENMLERSVSQAQHNLMVGVAHNPQFAQQVKVKQKVGQEFAQADVGHDISKLPIRVPKKK